jgi:hypothetical protein
MESGIRTVETDKDDDYTRGRLVFRPHHFVELHREKAGGVTCAPRTTRLGRTPQVASPCSAATSQPCSACPS